MCGVLYLMYICLHVYSYGIVYVKWVEIWLADTVDKKKGIIHACSTGLIGSRFWVLI